MSSILEAFKKLENDKKNSKPDQLRIDESILQDGSSARFSRFSLFLIAVALFVCGSGASYFYLKHDVTDAVVPQAIISVKELNRKPPVSMVKPHRLKNEPAQNSPVLPSAKVSRVSGTHTRALNDTTKSSRTLKSEKQVATTAVPEPKPVSIPSASTTAATRPTLTVNGIAFQDGGRSNMAMINGIPVSNGEMIEGVKVEDIQKSRVIFSQGGEKFEINLNKSNR